MYPSFSHEISETSRISGHILEVLGTSPEICTNPEIREPMGTLVKNPQKRRINRTQYFINQKSLLLQYNNECSLVLCCLIMMDHNKFLNLSQVQEIHKQCIPNEQLERKSDKTNN